VHSSSHPAWRPLGRFCYDALRDKNDKFAGNRAQSERVSVMINRPIFQPPAFCIASLAPFYG